MAHLSREIWENTGIPMFNRQYMDLLIQYIFIYIYIFISYYET